MTTKATKTFRHSTRFGKRIESRIIARMPKEWLDVYAPLVDDHAVHDIVSRSAFASENAASLDDSRRAIKHQASLGEATPSLP